MRAIYIHRIIIQLLLRGGSTLPKPHSNRQLSAHRGGRRGGRKGGGANPGGASQGPTPGYGRVFRVFRLFKVFSVFQAFQCFQCFRWIFRVFRVQGLEIRVLFLCRGGVWESWRFRDAREMQL